MCFLNTGVGNETFSYIETDHIPDCSECRYKHNFSSVAPCFDCNGSVFDNNTKPRKETGRSYFEFFNWG